MTLLDRHLFRRGALTFLLLCATVAVLISSIDLLVRFSQLMRGDLLPDQSRLALIATRFACQIPFFLKSFLPLMMAATVIVCLIPMLRHRQLMLLAASGIGGRRVCAGLLGLACLVGLVDVANRDLLLPFTEPLRSTSEDILQGDQSSTCTWRMPESGSVWFAEHYQRHDEVVTLGRVVAFADDDSLLYVEGLHFDGETWQAQTPIRVVDSARRLQRLEALPQRAVFALPESAEDLAALATPRQQWSGPRLLMHGEPAGRAIVYSRWLYLLAAPGAAVMAILVFARPVNRDRMTTAIVQAMLAAAVPVLLCSVADDLLLLGQDVPELWAGMVCIAVALPLMLLWRRSTV